MPTTDTPTARMTCRHSIDCAGMMELTVTSRVEELAARPKMLSMKGPNGPVVRRQYLSHSEAIQLVLGRDDAMILASMIQSLAYQLPVESKDG